MEMSNQLSREALRKWVLFVYPPKLNVPSVPDTVRSGEVWKAP